MRKILDYIGVRLYAFKHFKEYRKMALIKSMIFVVSLLAIFCIYETAVN